MSAPAAKSWDVLADKGKPGWQDRLLDDLWSSEGAKNYVTSLQVSMSIELRALIRAAADTRGMSTAAFVRRASIAFASNDLAMDYLDLCALAPLVGWHVKAPNGRAGTPDGVPPRARRDDGQGYGHWHACPGCEWEGYRTPRAAGPDLGKDEEADL